MPDRVSIGTMRDEYVKGGFAESLTNLHGARYNEIGGRQIWAVGDIGHLDVGRNKVAEAFLAGGTEWLLWIDADMRFTPADFDAIFARGKQGASIVSGLYYRASDPPTPCMFRYKKDPDGSVHNRVVVGFPKGKVLAVDGIGFGFVLTHRQVFLDIAKARYSASRPWFDNAQVGPHGQPLSEDLSFCLRAKEQGYDILVDTGVVLGHIKETVLYG